MTAKILVTGATGNIGSEIVKQLAAQAINVRALVRDPSKAEAINLPGVEIVSGDFDNINSLTSALQGIETVFLNIPDGNQKSAFLSFEEAKENYLKIGMPPTYVSDLIELYRLFDSGYGSAITDVVEKVGKKKPVSFAEFVQDNYLAFSGN